MSIRNVCTTYTSGVNKRLRFKSRIIMFLILILMISTAMITNWTASALEIGLPDFFHAFSRLLNPLDLKLKTKRDSKSGLKGEESVELSDTSTRKPFLYGLQKFFLDPEESIFVRSRNHLVETIGRENVEKLSKSLPEDVDDGSGGYVST